MLGQENVIPVVVKIVNIVVDEMKIETTDVVGGRGMQRNDGTLYLIEKDRAKL